MPHTIGDIIKIMEEIAPPRLAESWDNVGLMAGSRTASVNKIMIALDVTAGVVAEAAAKKVDLIISHHPVLFHPIKAVDDSTMTGTLLLKLLNSRIAVYSAHTNFDKAEGGTDDTLAQLLGLKDIRPLTLESLSNNTDAEFNEGQYSFGRIGRLPDRLTLETYLKQIKKTLNASWVNYVGDPHKVIEVVASCAGAGGDLVIKAREARADLFVTGEAKYHEMLPVLDEDMPMAVLGHYATEYPAMAALKRRLQKAVHALQYNIEIIPSEDYGNSFRRLRE